MHDRLRLAGGAAREGDQAGILRRELDRGGRLGGEQRLVGHVEDRRGTGPGGVALDSRRRHGFASWAASSSPRLRSSATISAGRATLQAQAQVLGAQLLGARQHDGADAKARDHRKAPTRGGCRSASSRRRRGARRAPAAHRPSAPNARRPRRSSTRAAAVARELDERAVVGGGALEDVAREVHGGAGYQRGLRALAGVAGVTVRRGRGRRRARRCGLRGEPRGYPPPNKREKTITTLERYRQWP